MKHPTKNLLVATLLIPGILIMGMQKAYAATGALGLNDFQVPIGSTTLVPITVNVTDGFIGGFAVTITYDESVIDVVSDANIVLNPTFTGTVTADAGAGTSTIQATTVSPSTGNVTLANVRFSGVGTTGSTTTVTVTPQAGSFVDQAATVFTPEPAPVSATATLVDMTPDVFSLPNQINVPLDTPIDSAQITITGIDVPTAISINNGAQYSINGGAFTSDPGTVVSGNTVVVRLQSSASYSTATSTFLRVGLGGDDFRVTTIPDPALDNVPDGFSFANQINVPVNTAIDSAPITVSGINIPTPISITGGEYSINGGAFTSAAGTVENGNTVSVRLLSSPSFLTQTVAVLNIGGVTDDFRITTVGEPDTTPDAFSFVDQVDVAVNTPIDSAPITVTGINSPTPISVVGGEYAINGGAFTSAAGTVNNGESVVVRQTSSASFLTPTTATLTIGGVSDDFTLTTITEPDTTPDAFTLVDQTDVALSIPIDSAPITVTGINSPAPILIVGGEYSINGSAFTTAAGTVNNNETVIVRQTSSASFATPTDAVLTIGGVSDTFTVTTLAEDTTPDAFTFVDQVDAAVNTPIDSTPITVTGINSPAAISIVGGEYAINGGAFTALAGTVNANDTVVARITSSASFTTPVDAVLTIGGISDTFTVTTLAEDTIPDTFTFVDQVDIPVNTQVTSAPITVTGINSPAPISIVGGEYAINGGIFTVDPGTVNANDTVVVRQTSSASFNTTTDTVLTIGGVSDTFSVITVGEPGDTTPNPFAFTDQVDAVLATQVESNAITVSGITSPAPISIVGGEYSINGGAFTSLAGNVNGGESVVVRLTTSASFATPTDAVLTIGGVSDTFTVTTLTEDNTPDAFTFVDQVDVAVNTPIDSTPITVTGINSPAPISIVGGEYSINGGAFTVAAGTVNNNETVVVRVISSASFSTPVDAVLTISGVSDTFTVTTAAEDTAPDAFTFVDQTDVTISTPIESAAITVTDINSPAPISVVGGEYSVNGGAFTAVAGTVNNNESVVARVTSSASFSTPVDAVLTIGGVSDTFTVTTAAEVINGAPVLAAIAAQNVQVNNPLTFTAQASDPEGDTLSFSLASAPTGAAIDSATGVFSWTPTETGTFTFDVIVSDGTLTNSQTVTVTVSSEPVVEPEPTPITTITAAKKDTCGDTCEKYKDLKDKYKTKENKRIYQSFKTMRDANPAEFARLETIYRNYRDWSDNERSVLDAKTLSEFKMFKTYAGYKHYRNLKERLDK